MSRWRPPSGATRTWSWTRRRARGTPRGRSVLDFTCGIGVTNLGHRHPAVVKAVHEQVDRLWHVSAAATSWGW